MSDDNKSAAKPLLGGPPTVINIGLERFATDLVAAGVAVTQVQWQPPARGNAKLAALLAKLGS
jgi:FdrA protein